MKNIGDKIKSSFKKAKNSIGKYAAVGALALLPYISSAQDIKSTYTTPTDSVPYGVIINQDGQIHTEEQTLSKDKRESRYDDLNLIQSVDLYNQPNNHEKFLGKNKLDYAYSGDANNDEALDLLDVKAIQNGEKNYRTDVNFDGTTNSTDANLLEDHITNGTPLPSQAFSNPNATRAEKDALGLETIYKNWDNVKYIMQTLHGDCENITNYVLGTTRGIEDFENLPLISEFEDKNTQYNVPFVRIDTYNGYFNNFHAINGFYSGKTNDTNMLNILDFKNKYTKIEPQLQMWPEGFVEIGDNSLNEYANVKVLLRNEIDGEKYLYTPSINFNFVGDKVEVKRINNNYMLTNPNAIETAFEKNSSDTLNYQSNLNVENQSTLGITTNVDLDSEINTVSDSNAKFKNILRTTTILGDKIPLSENPELADIYYKQNIETIVGYIQQVKHTLGQNSNLLKEDTFNQTIVVDDLEAPKVEGFETEQSNNYVANKDWQKEVENSLEAMVTDNSNLDVDKTFTTTSTQQMDGSINQVNYDITTNIKLTDKRNNTTKLQHTRHVRDTQAPMIYMPEDTTYQIKKGENPLEAIVIDSITDNSNLPVETNISSQIIDENGHYRTYEVTVQAQDIAGKIAEKTTTVKEDLGTGIQDLQKENKSLDIDVYPNPVRNNATIRLSSNKEIENGMIIIRDVLGRVVDRIEVDRVESNIETEIPYIGFGVQSSGNYFVTFRANGKQDTEKIIKR